MFVDLQYAIGFRSTPLAPRNLRWPQIFVIFYPESQGAFYRVAAAAAAADWSIAQDDKRVTECPSWRCEQFNKLTRVDDDDGMLL